MKHVSIEVRIGALIFILLSIVYFLTATAYRGGGDMRYSVATAKALVKNHSLEIYNGLYSGCTIKPEHSQDGIGWYYLNKKSGKAYSRYGIGLPIILVPYVYAAEKLALLTNLPEDFLINVSVSLYNVIFGAGACLIMYLLCRFFKNSTTVSAAMALVLGLATMCWRYSTCDFSEAAQMFFLLLSVYCVVRNTSKSLMLGAIAYAYLILLKPAYIVYAPAFLIYIYAGAREERKPAYRRIGLFFALACASFGLILVLNYGRSGSFFNFGYGGAKYPFEFRLSWIWSHGIRLLLSLNKGLFIYNPVLILSCLGFAAFLKKFKRQALFFLFLIAINIMFISSYNDWHGDWSWGPRYLVPLIPFWLLPLATLMHPKRRLIMAVIILLIAVSCVIQALSVAQGDGEYHWIRYNLRYSTEVKSDGAGPMPPDIAGYFILLKHKISEGNNIYKLSEFGLCSDSKVDTGTQGFEGFSFLFCHLSKYFNEPAIKYVPVLFVPIIVLLLLLLRKMVKDDEAVHNSPRI